MRIAACSSASTCVSLMPARIFCRAAKSRGKAAVPSLVGAGLAEQGVARLVAGIAVHIGDVVGADDVALRPRVVALAGVGNEVAARVQDAVRPVGAPAQTAADDAAVDGALRLAGRDGRKDLEVGIVEQVGALLG